MDVCCFQSCGTPAEIEDETAGDLSDGDSDLDEIVVK